MKDQFQVLIRLTQAGADYAREKLKISNPVIGQQFPVKVNVAVCMIAKRNSDTFVCLGKKPDNQEWTFPGGKIEIDEEKRILSKPAGDEQLKILDKSKICPPEYKADSDPRFTIQASEPSLTRSLLLGCIRETYEETSVNLLDYNADFDLKHRAEIFPDNLEYMFIKYLSPVIFANLGCVDDLPNLSSQEFEKVAWFNSGTETNQLQLRASTKMWLDVLRS